MSLLCAVAWKVQLPDAGRDARLTTGALKSALASTGLRIGSQRKLLRRAARKSPPLPKGGRRDARNTARWPRQRLPLSARREILGSGCP